MNSSKDPMMEARPVLATYVTERLRALEGGSFFRGLNGRKVRLAIAAGLEGGCELEADNTPYSDTRTGNWKRSWSPWYGAI